MTAQIQVTLHGTNGTITKAVTPQGFPTRHVNTGKPKPTESVKITSDLPMPEAAPVITPEPRSPASHNPLGEELNALLAEVDNLLNPKPRVNNEPIRGYHYIDPPKRKTNDDSPLMAYWDCVMQRKSDERMAYLRNRKAVK